MRRAVAEEMALALMMAKHDRLGRASAVRVLPIEVLQAIAEAATTFHVAANRALLPDFTSIAQAVRKVPDGSTILVHDGDYIEISPIVITSRIALVSASHVAAAAAERHLPGCRRSADAHASFLSGGESGPAAEAGLAGEGSGANGLPTTNASNFLLTGIPPTIGGLLLVGVGVGGGPATEASQDEQEEEQGAENEVDATSNAAAAGNGGGGGGIGENGPETPESFDSVQGTDAEGRSTQGGRQRGMRHTAVTVRMFVEGDAQDEANVPPLLVISTPPLACAHISGITFLHLKASSMKKGEAEAEDVDTGSEAQVESVAESHEDALEVSPASGGALSHDVDVSVSGVGLGQGMEGRGGVGVGQGAELSGDSRGDAGSHVSAGHVPVDGIGGKEQDKSAVRQGVKRRGSQREREGGCGAEGSTAAGAGRTTPKCAELCGDADASDDAVAVLAVAAGGGEEGHAQEQTVQDEISDTVVLSGGEAVDEGASLSLAGVLGEEGAGVGGKGGIRCVEILRGMADFTNCVMTSELGNGVVARGSGSVVMSRCCVSDCGLHGVSALRGALVVSERCRVSHNALSGYNAVGHGACVRCHRCDVRGNEDGGVNVVQGALALTSASGVHANRGTGVRAIGKGSLVVASDCCIALNAWHGVSAVESGAVLVQRSCVDHNHGAGLNAFSLGRASVRGSALRQNRFAVWAQNEAFVEMLACQTGPSGHADFESLGASTISVLP